MRRLAAIAIPVLFALPFTPVAVARAEQPATPLRTLSKADAERAKELYAQAVALGRQGKFVEAQGPIRALLDLRTRVLGADHFETGDARREIDTLKRLAALPEKDQEEYRTTYTLSDEATEFENKGQYAAALRPAKQVLDIYRRLLGPDSYVVAVAAHRYGVVLHQADRCAEAEAQFREALRIVRAVAGEDHADVAEVSGDLATSLERLGKYAEARQLHTAALELNARLRGEAHPDTAVSANNLGCFLDRQALYADAERLHRRAIAAFRAAGASEERKLATSYGNLALTLNHQGKYDKAEVIYLEALKLQLKLSGENHPNTGRVYLNLASTREAMGSVAEAEALYCKALDSYRKGYGDNSWQTAWAMNNLGVNLDKQRKYAEGERLLREALAVLERLPTPPSRDIAMLSNNLASCLQGQDKDAEAETLCVKALTVLREAMGPDHPEVAVALNNVAVCYHNNGKYDAATRYLRDALAITQRRLGADHGDTSTARVNLAVNLHYQGEYDEADRLFREALAAERRVLGEGHQTTAWTYKNLALSCCARGDHAQADALAAAATESFEVARRRVSFAGLERARSAADLSPLPALAVAAARAGKPEAGWQAFERDLARGLLDDVSARPLSAEDRRRKQDLSDQLDRLDRKVAAQPAGSDTPAAAEVRQQRDAALSQFVRLQSELAARYGVLAGEVYDLARIQARLPADAALVGWVDLPDPGHGKRVDPVGDHWACVVRHKGTPAWVRLRGTGPSGAWTDEDARLRARVRRALADRPSESDRRWEELTRQLAALRLTPLEDRLNVIGDLPAVRHLIVLPSPKMAGIPVEALTSRHTVSYAPSGTLFAWLSERSSRRPAAAVNLLALGDPAFQPPADGPGTGAKPGAADASRRETFARLPGTRQELMGVARVFPETRLLMGSQASEQTLDRLAAAGDLRAYRYLHFATHGVLDDHQPLRSALVLAREPGVDRLERVLDGQDIGDGRLTAERILRRWKLDADLVTLSACDTGIGQFSGGEGYLGFSQVLFVAGARSLVLSLWQVEDAATALLMTRFYENLLGTPEGTVKPMPKAVALAEAKRWLRGLGADEVQELTKDLHKRGTRGRVEPRDRTGAPKAARTYEHPYYWSGFILVGDPQ